MNSFLLKCVSMKEITVSLFFWLLMAACRVFIDFLDKEGEWLYEYVWSFIWDILDNLILFFEAPIFGRSVGGSFPCSPPPDWIVTFLSISFAIREGSGYRIRWIKIPKGLWPPPLFLENYVANFLWQIWLHICKEVWWPDSIKCMHMISRGGPTAVLNLSENSSNLVAWPIP